jgi:hypothetical protein
MRALSLPETGFALRILSPRAQAVYSGKQPTKRFPRTKKPAGDHILSAGNSGPARAPL